MDVCRRISEIIKLEDSAAIKELIATGWKVNSIFSHGRTMLQNYETPLNMIVRAGWQEGMEILVKAGVILEQANLKVWQIMTKR